MRMLRWINGNKWKDKIIGYETFLDIWWSNVLVCVWIEIILSASASVSASTFCFVFFLGTSASCTEQCIKANIQYLGEWTVIQKFFFIVFNFQ